MSNNILAKLLRRADVPSSLLVKSADALDATEVSLEGIAQAFAKTYAAKRRATDLFLSRPDGTYRPAAETMLIIPAFVKCWLRERNLTSQFSKQLCVNFHDYLIADCPKMDPRERIASDEIIVAELQQRAVPPPGTMRGRN